jgi:hypothetical protein
MSPGRVEVRGGVEVFVLVEAPGRGCHVCVMGRRSMMMCQGQSSCMCRSLATLPKAAILTSPRTQSVQLYTAVLCPALLLEGCHRVHRAPRAGKRHARPVPPPPRKRVHATYAGSRGCPSRRRGIRKDRTAGSSSCKKGIQHPCTVSGQAVRCVWPQEHTRTRRRGEAGRQ